MRIGRPPKGPRLYLRERPGRPAAWIIRDGSRQHGTGCGAEDRAGADQALQAYLANKYAPPSGPSSLDKLLIADVMHRYLAERAPHVARPDFLQTTAIPIIEWWSGKTLADVRGNACRAYVDWRTGKVSVQTARHDLKTLRAAINHYHKEHGPLPAVPTVSLPTAGAPRDRWLTRQEAALLLKAAWRRKETRHVARFLLVALYTGTRSKAIRALRWLPSTTGGHVDLERGVMFRRSAGATQTKKRAPPVRLPTRLVAHLRRWQRADAVHGITHVVHYQGAPVGKLRRSWGTIRSEAGLGEDVVPHTCRHTAATWLMQRGVDHFEAAGFLGMSVTTLEAVYGHHDPAWQRNAADRISRR